MSYEIVKSISHKKKDNRIFITSASNNVWPRNYSRWEYMPNEKCNDEDNRNKMLHLFHGIIGGSLQLSGSVGYKWRYAENKFREYCKNNNISTSEIWELPYKEEKYNINILKPYYDIFETFLTEDNIKGNFYLKSNLGYITKITSKGFEYNPYWLDINKCYKDYKNIYNDYCKLPDDSIKKYNIKIEEYVLEKNSDKTQNKEDTEYSI